MTARLLFLLFASLCAAAQAGGGTKCAACGIVIGLLEETNSKSLEVDLAVGLLCGSKCSKSLKKNGIDMVKNKTNPDTVCSYLGICTGNCTLFPTWPLKSLPSKPPQDPKNKRRRLASVTGLRKDIVNRRGYAGLDDLIAVKRSEGGFYELVQMLLHIFNPANENPLLHEEYLMERIKREARNNVPGHPCGLNISCIKHRFLDLHWPVSDHDGDVFASVKNRGLRGSHWRGADCK